MESFTKTLTNSHETGKEAAQYYSQAVQLVTSAALPMVLHNAVKLKLFETISKSENGEKLSSSQIASQLSSKSPDAAAMLDRMLLLLSSFSLFTCEVLEVASEDGTVQYERVYGLSPVGQFFVPDEEGNTIACMVEVLQDKAYIDSWYELGNSILEGGMAFERAHGMNLYEYNGKNARFDELFNKGLAGATSTTMKLLLKVYKGFEGIETLVDVGGGHGAALHMITSKYPQMKGINFDLPHVLKDAPSYPGVKHIGGDMFQSVPEGDAIFLKLVLHNWSDDHCLKILNKCLKAIPENGKVVVVDFILPLKPDTTGASTRSVCQADNLMMSVCPGGKERSEFEFRALAKGAGFKGMEIKYHGAGDVGIIEMYK